MYANISCIVELLSIPLFCLLQVYMRKDLEYPSTLRYLSESLEL